MPLKVGLWEQAKTRNQEVISNVSLDPISGTRIIERFAPRPYYFASEDEDLLKEVDEAISIIKQVQPSLPDVLFDKYFRNTRYVFAPTQQQSAVCGARCSLCLSERGKTGRNDGGNPE